MKGLIEDIRDGQARVVFHRLLKVLMEVLTTPLCSVFTCVTVKDGKKPLSMNLIEGGNESMGIFHKSSWTLSVGNCTRILEMFWPVRGRIRLAVIKLGDLNDTDWW